MKKFNSNFMFGAATAAHQVEGNNVNSDFWAMESIPSGGYDEPSLDAVDHYNRYREDIKLLVDAGLNAYRFSIEWARIEPTKGNFEKKEIEHYRDVLKCCHENKVTPIVTLHHFSSPKWLITEGGWESESTIEYFGKYCTYVVSELGDLIPYICTINEANMGVQIGRLIKEYMSKMAMAAATKPNNANEDVQVGINISTESPQEKHNSAVKETFGIDAQKLQFFLAPRTDAGDVIVMKCHMKAREAIKAVNPNIKVGITMSLYDYQAQAGGEEIVQKLWDEDFLHYLPYIQEDDFFGVQNYTRKVFNSEGKVQPDKEAKMSDVGNEFFPDSLVGVIRFVSKHWTKPIIVTENGVATTNDKDRVELIEKVMKGLYDCIEDGLSVIGYMHWSLLDNFEWQKGYKPKFGLIAVDRTTQSRYPKDSLAVLGNINRFGI